MGKILVVDDDAQIRRLIRVVLQRNGHTVEEASDGHVALTMARDSAYDIVVTDIIMPNVEGIELISTLRKTQPEAPLIAISGGGQYGEYLPIAEKLGASQTFAKPLDLNKLATTVNDLL